MTTLSPQKRRENRQRAEKYRGHREPQGMTIGAAIGAALRHPDMEFLATAAGGDEQHGQSTAWGEALLPPASIADPFGRPILTPTEFFVSEVDMSGPQAKIPARTDNDHSTGSVTGGLSFSTRAETFATTATRIETEQVTIDSHINSAAVYLTDELLQDGQGVRKLLTDAAFAEMRAEKERQRISGTGAGEGEGVLSCPASINLTRQTASNITEQDVKAMRKRCYNYTASAWFANPDTITELEELYITFSTLSAAPMLTHSGGQAFLSGRPLFLTERCSALGTAGDLILADFSQMVEGNYSQETVESIHVRFLNHESIMRFSFRYDCRSLWRAALTPEKGANSLSPFVVLN